MAREVRTILEEFGEKSQDADTLKTTVLDIVRLISESEDDRDWDFGSFLSSPLSPHQGDVDVEGVDSLKNLILSPESYKDGGKVGKDYYSQLAEVAKKKDFDLNQLTDMFIIESSGNPDAVNPLGYTGGFQFGKKSGKEYGLVGEGFDDRKDLMKSASAAIDMYRKNLRDDVKTSKGSWSLGEKTEEMGIPSDLAGYLAHQQGRSGLIDILTGATSGKIKKKTKEAMLANIGDKKDASSLGNKELISEYLNFWKGRYGEKQEEAENWRKENRTIAQELVGK
jgi:hypothetical protein